MPGTDVALEELTAEEARRMLAALSPMLERLRGIARDGSGARPPRLARETRSRAGVRRTRRVAIDFGSVAGGPPSVERVRTEPRDDDVSRSSPADTPRLGQLAREDVRALVEEEWSRRTDRPELTGDVYFRSLISSLLACGLEPRNPDRVDTARSGLRELRRAVESDGTDAEDVDRELRVISGAVWHVLLTADIPIEHAMATREAIDRVLLEGVAAEHGAVV